MADRDGRIGICQKTAVPPARNGHAMAYIGDKKVLLFGGIGGSGMEWEYKNDTWVFDLNGQIWAEVNPVGDIP